MSSTIQARKPLKLDAKRCPAISEAHVQNTVSQLLQLDGWRRLRTDPVSDRSRGKGFGEPGMADDLFIRYGYFPLHVEYRRAVAEVLWVEFKKKGKEPPPHQLAWHEAERKRGALVLVVDDIDEFIKFYASSGLSRLKQVAQKMNELSPEDVLRIKEQRA